MSVWDRCISRGVPGSMLPAGYNNAYRIVQTPDHFVIQHEMIHDVRIIPLSESAALPRLRMSMLRRTPSAMPGGVASARFRDAAGVGARLGHPAQ